MDNRWNEDTIALIKQTAETDYTESSRCMRSLIRQAKKDIIADQGVNTATANFLVLQLNEYLDELDNERKASLPALLSRKLFLAGKKPEIDDLLVSIRMMVIAVLKGFNNNEQPITPGLIIYDRLDAHNIRLVFSTAQRIKLIQDNLSFFEDEGRHFRKQGLKKIKKEQIANLLTEVLKLEGDNAQKMYRDAKISELLKTEQSG
ncbi:hypothetical protein [Bacterioplanoides sp.]|uniref:hypothetical protein n=1 Tax=Bacterioplanoides sp. TaxID=2066072 RepID=UPI003B5B153C